MFYFLIASAICLSTIGTTDSRWPVTNRQAFGSITPEVAMKMQVTNPCPPVWLREANADIERKAVVSNCGDKTHDFALADERVAWAKANGYTVWGHTLVWAYQHAPYLSTPLPAAWRESVLREHIYAQVTHFCGNVVAWDVINEYFDAGLGIWASIDDVLYKAFLWAGDALDKCGAGTSVKLFFNNGSSCYDSIAHAKLAINEVLELRKRGVRVDGVADQCHIGLSSQNMPKLGTMIDVMSMYQLHNISTRFSEVDLQLWGDADEAMQAESVRRIVTACRFIASCAGVTFWGQDDGSSWLNFMPFVERVNALLFDREMRPKPAYSAAVEAATGCNRKVFLPFATRQNRGGI